MNDLNKKTIWLLTTGDGEDGSEWDVKSIHETNQGAIYAKKHYERDRNRPDGSTYNHYAQIEEWELKQ